MDGTPFGRYRLIELLGRGGMGEVWRAYDTDTDRVVAIKVLPAHLSDDEMFQQRFRREAHAAARLNSPHVIPIHHYGEIDGRLYVDMRLIEGRDLEAVLADGPIVPARAVRIIEGVAEALQAAHKVGLVHRDVKPSNILLDENDFAYLIDFGIARAAADTRLTRTGGMIGTFQYMAPERFGSRQEDARADIYALACVLYECLTGQPPFAEDSAERLMAAHLNTPPPRPSTTQPDVPPQVDEVIATGMAKDPDNRYATTVELATAAHDAITTPLAPPSKPTLLDNAAPAAAPGPILLDDQVRPMQPPAPDAAIPPTKTGVRPLCRGIKITLIAGAVALVAVIAAAVGISAITGHRPSRPSPTSSESSPTPSEQGPSALVTLPFAGLNSPDGVAVDPTGNLYVTDRGHDRVLKLPAGSVDQAVLPLTGLKGPGGVAVNPVVDLLSPGGALYVTDRGNDRVLKLSNVAIFGATQTVTVLPFTGLKGPDAVAVDAVDALFVADRGNNRVLKLSAGAATQTVLPFTGLNSPDGVAVDPTGNLYVTDTGNNRVLKLSAGAATQEVLPFTGLQIPTGVAVDFTGNLYVADTGNRRVLKLPAGSDSQTVLPAFTGLNYPDGVAVDHAGNLYVTDHGNNRVLKLPAQ